MKDLKELVKDFFKSDGQDRSKRKIHNLAIFMVIGIILLLVGGFFTDDKSANNLSDVNLSSQELVTSKQNNFDEYDKTLESKIKDILSQIDGVGKVEIALTYLSGEEIVPAQDTKQNESNTKEQDREGGARTTVQMDTDSKVIVGNQSQTTPVVLKVIPPQVKGVIVVAQGAKSDVVKVSISNAVSTLLGISLSKVEVFPMSN